MAQSDEGCLRIPIKVWNKLEILTFHPRQGTRGRSSGVHCGGTHFTWTLQSLATERASRVKDSRGTAAEAHSVFARDRLELIGCEFEPVGQPKGSLSNVPLNLNLNLNLL